MLTSCAPRAPMTDAEALAELRRNRGVQFDPELVDAFIELFGTGGPEPDAEPGTEPGAKLSTEPRPRAVVRARASGA